MTGRHQSEAGVGASQPNGSEPPPLSTDVADLSSLRINTGIGDPLAFERHHKVPVGKPKDYFRTHPGQDYRGLFWVYKHRSDNMIGEQWFLIAEAMQEELMDYARPHVILTLVDRLWLPRLWPLTQPKPEENDNDAWFSARAVARDGLTAWVKPVFKARSFISRMAEEGYAPEPAWKELGLPTFNELLNLAFGRDGVIRDRNHPIAMNLLGIAQRSPLADDDPLNL